MAAQPLKKERIESVILGLAVGDALGSTSEFQIPWEVPKLFTTYPGWPRKQVGGGKGRWKVGQATDDTIMAMCILRAIEKKHGFDPSEIASNFVKWKQSGPPDIGCTTALSLQVASSHLPEGWFEGGLDRYNHNKSGAANGSLMRNGPIPALYYLEPIHVLIEYTVKHGMITHWGPLPTLCCVIHSVLIASAMTKDVKDLKPPTLSDIQGILDGPWKDWKEQTKDPICKKWLASMGKSLVNKEIQLMKELKDFEKYDPWHQDYRGRSGYCVLTLRISLWSLYWSFQTTHPKIAEWLPEDIFNEHGFNAIMWVVTIGADADTYGATAGALLGAFQPNVPSNFTDNLEVLDEVKTLVRKILGNSKN